MHKCISRSRSRGKMARLRNPGNWRVPAGWEDAGFEPRTVPIFTVWCALPLSHRTLIIMMIVLGTRTISNSSLVLPRPPEDLPRGFYEGFIRESSSKESAPTLPHLNIGKISGQFSVSVADPDPLDTDSDPFSFQLRKIHFLGSRSFSSKKKF